MKRNIPPHLIPIVERDRKKREAERLRKELALANLIKGLKKD
jgi:hypothetical protein